VWTPVTLQYKDILEKLQEHKTLLDFEISNASTQEAMKFYNMVEETLLNDERPAERPNQRLREEEEGISRKPSASYAWLALINI
jgi:hypothetical protein